MPRLQVIDNLFADVSLVKILQTSLIVLLIYLIRYLIYLIRHLMWIRYMRYLIYLMYLFYNISDKSGCVDGVPDASCEPQVMGVESSSAGPCSS